jgi:hypothetical protein
MISKEAKIDTITQYIVVYLSGTNKSTKYCFLFTLYPVYKIMFNQKFLRDKHVVSRKVK